MDRVTESTEWRGGLAKALGRDDHPWALGMSNSTVCVVASGFITVVQSTSSFILASYLVHHKSLKNVPIRNEEPQTETTFQTTNFER